MSASTASEHDNNSELLSNSRRKRDKKLHTEEFSQKPQDRLWKIWRFKDSDESKARRITRRIVTLGKRKQLSQITEIIEKSKSSSEPLNRISMNAALSAFVNGGKVNKALELYKEMVFPRGCGVDNITYGIILKGLGREQRLDDAFELVEALESGNLPGCFLSSVHVATLLDACAQAGDTLRARGLLRIMQTFSERQGPKLDPTLTYNLLIKSHAMSALPLSALKVVEEMKQQGIQMDRVTFNSLILACVKGNDMESAMALLSQMKESPSSSVAPDASTYTTMLKGLTDISSIQKTVQEMRECAHCTMDRVAFTAIIDACVRVGCVEEAMSFLAEMEELAIRPRAHAFLALLRQLAVTVGGSSAARQLSSRMAGSASGHVASSERAESDQLVLESLLKDGQITNAKNMLEEIMDRTKGKPNFTARGSLAFVKLMAATDFSDRAFQPVLFKEEISPWSPVDAVMLTLDQLQPVYPWQSLSEIQHRFVSQPCLPVCDEEGVCVGVVSATDCAQMERSVEAVMQPPPPRINGSTLVFEASEMLIRENVPFLAVTEEDVNMFMKKRLLGMKGDAVEDCSDVVIGFIGMKQLFLS